MDLHFTTICAHWIHAGEPTDFNSIRRSKVIVSLWLSWETSLVRSLQKYFLALICSLILPMSHVQTAAAVKVGASCQNVGQVKKSKGLSFVCVKQGKKTTWRKQTTSTPKPSPTPTSTPTSNPSPSPTVTPTITPTPIASPNVTPTQTPTPT